MLFRSLLGNVGGEKVTRLRDQTVVPHVAPTGGEDAVLFLFKDLLMKEERFVHFSAVEVIVQTVVLVRSPASGVGFWPARRRDKSLCYRRLLVRS